MPSPHDPVTNLAREAPQASMAQFAEGEIGGEDYVLEPGGDGRETAAIDATTRESMVAAAPMRALPDIGTASFHDPDGELEAVHGPDNRARIKQTTAYPYRVNTSLLITASDGSQWIGTGWFISSRTLVTAGHCVYIKNSPVAGRDGWVKSIQAMPGRNEDRLPYGSVTSNEFWTVRGWADAGDENYDYGAIILPTPLGERVGKLGFANLPDAALRGAIANVTGYPGDKPPGELWDDSKAIAAVSATRVIYDIDTGGGQSGAAVYIVRGGRQLAVAIHAYGGATSNSGTRISAPVFANLSAWKA